MRKGLFLTIFTLLISLTLCIFSGVEGYSPKSTPNSMPTYQLRHCKSQVDEQITFTSDHCLFTSIDQQRPLSSFQKKNALSLDLPDLNVRYITQSPRYEYSAPKNQHEPGDSMTFTGHIANRGNLPTGPFNYEWRIDGVVISSGTVSELSPSETKNLSVDWIWQSGPHSIRLYLDSPNKIAEISELNNLVEDRTNALAVGFWVEQSVYDWFNTRQAELGLGSVSWDDWAQRQLQKWNEMFAAAVHPLTPQGVIERVRLDKVTIIPNGTWQDCANWPNPEDRTVDLVWGFPSELVGVDSGRICPPFNFYINNPQFQDYEPPLLHEMSHARYLIDLYGLNVYVNAAYLTSAVNASATTFMTDRNVEQDNNFPLPVSLAVGGELVICQSKAGNAFKNCARGAEGTSPRSHPQNTGIHLATVRVQDGRGNLIQGSPALPIIGDWKDHLYLNRYPDDLMSGGLGYGQHSAYAWNRIIGQRPVCGNYNAPCNIGEYLNDIPEENVLEIRNLQGVPISWAQVEVYQANPFPIWYGRYFDGTPDIIKTAGSAGRVDLGSFPFGYGDTIEHTWGISNALILIKITSGGEMVYRFFEVTQSNEAYWSGDVQTAVYTITADLPFSEAPTHTPTPTITPILTNTPTPTITSTPTAPPLTNTPTITPILTNTPTPTITSTPTAPPLTNRQYLPVVFDDSTTPDDSPTHTPTPTATQLPIQAPEFDYPVDGQTLDFEGDYLFRVYEIEGISDYLWGFFQEGVLVWENSRDEGQLSSNEYGVYAGTEAHSRFAKGDVDVWVRALGEGGWSDAQVITIHLE